MSDNDLTTGCLERISTFVFDIGTPAPKHIAQYRIGTMAGLPSNVLDLKWAVHVSNDLSTWHLLDDNTIEEPEDGLHSHGLAQEQSFIVTLLGETFDACPIGFISGVTTTSTNTSSPTNIPTASPTASPTDTPTAAPTNVNDTHAPTEVPTAAPTDVLTDVPTVTPTDAPTTTRRLLVDELQAETLVAAGAGAGANSGSLAHRHRRLVTMIGPAGATCAKAKACPESMGALCVTCLGDGEEGGYPDECMSCREGYHLLQQYTDCTGICEPDVPPAVVANKTLTECAVKCDSGMLDCVGFEFIARSNATDSIGDCWLHSDPSYSAGDAAAKESKSGDGGGKRGEGGMNMFCLKDGLVDCSPATAPGGCRRLDASYMSKSSGQRLDQLKHRKQ
jgi:hypothetical protein